MTVRYSMHNTIGLPYYSHPHAHSAQDCQGALSDGEIAAIVIVPFGILIAVIIVITLILLLRKNNVICNDNCMSKDETPISDLQPEPPAYNDVIKESMDPPPAQVELDVQCEKKSEATNQIPAAIQEQPSSEQMGNSTDNAKPDYQNVNKNGGNETTDPEADSSKSPQGTVTVTSVDKGN